MASSIIGGLIQSGWQADTISVSDPNPQTRVSLESQFKVRTYPSNIEAAAKADVVLLAVKPQVIGDVCDEIATHLATGSLVLSIAAGVSSASMAQRLKPGSAIVRCMPNTPALLQHGASVLFANVHVSEAQKQLAQKILNAVGDAHWIDAEELMDAVTAVSGSGPAYFFLILEAMIDAGVELGLDNTLASALATQTALGAAALAKQSPEEITTLRKRVTSPNGTTERAIESFENQGLRDIFKEAMTACAQRSKELGKL